MMYASTTYRTHVPPPQLAEDPSDDLDERMSYDAMVGSGSEMGERARQMMVSSAKDFIRPVFMPIQQLGRRGRQLGVSSLAQSLPGIVNAALPSVKKELEEKLRDLATGRSDINLLAPVPDHLRLVVELSDDVLGLADRATVAAGATGQAVGYECENRCGFFIFEGTHCCTHCKLRPGNHGPLCKRLATPTPLEEESSIATSLAHGAEQTAKGLGSMSVNVLNKISGGALGAQDTAALPDIVEEISCVLTKVSRAVAQGDDGGGDGRATSAGHQSPASNAAASKAAASKAAASNAEASTSAAPTERRIVSKIAFEATVDVTVQFRPNTLTISALAAPGTRHARKAEDKEQGSGSDARGQGRPSEAYRRLSDAAEDERKQRSGDVGSKKRYPLLVVKPGRFKLRGRIRVWWELEHGEHRHSPMTHAPSRHACVCAAAHSQLRTPCAGMLNVVFLRDEQKTPPPVAGPAAGEPVPGAYRGAPAAPGRAGPHFDVSSAVDLLGCLPLQCVTDRILPPIVARLLASFSPERPLKLPLQVPVALKVTTGDAEDEKDSLASMHGVVREASRVLTNLTNPISVDSSIPRAVLKRAKGLVVITRISAGALLYGGGFGSGIMLRKLDDGRWSGPVSIQTVSMAFGPQFGVRKSDTLLCLLSDSAIQVFSKAIDGIGQLKLGGQASIAAGPVGRDASLDARISQGGVASVLSYSHAQGGFAGATVEGEQLFGRQADNEEYYFREGVTAEEVLWGRVEPPEDTDSTAMYAILDKLTTASAPEASQRRPNASLAENTLASLSAGAEAVGSGVGHGAAELSNGVQALGQGVGHGVQAVGDGLQAVGDGVGSGLKSGVLGVQQGFQSFGAGIGSMFGGGGREGSGEGQSLQRRRGAGAAVSAESSNERSANGSLW